MRVLTWISGLWIIVRQAENTLREDNKYYSLSVQSFIHGSTSFSSSSGQFRSLSLFPGVHGALFSEEQSVHCVQVSQTVAKTKLILFNNLYTNSVRIIWFAWND